MLLDSPKDKPETIFYNQAIVNQFDQNNCVNEMNHSSPMMEIAVTCLMMAYYTFITLNK